MKRLARTPHGGADATLDHWKAEAEAAAAGSPVKATAAAEPKSPPKRRRQKSPELEPDDDFMDAEDQVVEEEEEGADARAEAEAMNMGQLKHQLQVNGLAHLYVGKKGLKKADLVEMFLNN